ncbi:FecR domain-containing protein [Panacibacter sp. DH6]|uniref:FecR domain-containing protein n=1 Tax=Panacibacter microcysteis TaxID=2793269 RepID=A0A931GVP7_9BACT|nr:FecR domain-containing protein [Panacibacter microcysteis]MBG9375313.1 FecR domain-containing protein [Panacibacter microcysteis]
MARSLSGEATAEEQEQLMQILAQDFALQQQYDLMKRMWHPGETKEEPNSIEEDTRHISRILQLAKTETIPGEDIPVIQIRSRRKYFYALSGVAAVLVIFIMAWMFTGTQRTSTPPEKEAKQNLVAENGSRTRTILPDGSTVWLNAGSHVTYDKDFTGKTREVTLDGEAYFDVVKLPDRPFVVHVSGYDIRVLGTAFNVKSYVTDKTVETTLIRGLVQVTRHGAKVQKPILLHPNQKLIVGKLAAESTTILPDDREAPQTKIADDYHITQLTTPVHEDERIETAWVYNRLLFRGESFAELASKMERWYNVKIVFDDDAVKQLNFTGSFETETVAEAFYALKAAQDFDFGITGKEIHVQSVK